MILLFTIITLCYLLLISVFIYGFNAVELFSFNNQKPKTKFTIVVPFRNESEHISKLLNSIERLEYPKSGFEVILVDDASEDNSVSIIKKVLDKNLSKDKFTRTNISLITNERKTNSPKKDAITMAINHAKNEWIITTDADCVVPKFWLNTFDNFIQGNKTSCIVAPVNYNVNSAFLERFQLLDFLSLQGVTIGGFGIKKPILCNGANFAYKKALFKTVNGFEGNTTIASGDDIFLLEKALSENSKQVHYLKSKHAIVKTYPQKSFKALVSQRKRWAAKISAYSNTFSKVVGLLVLIMNALLVCGLILVISNSLSPTTLLYIFVIKISIDFLLLFKTYRFFGNKINVLDYILACLIYPFFNTYIAFSSVFSGYKWKGRTYTK